MEFGIKSGHPEKQRSHCVVVGVHEKRKLTPAAARIDEAGGGRLAELLKRGDLSGKFGQTLMLHDVPGMSAERLLLVGCGKERELDDGRYQKLAGHVVNAVRNTGVTEAISFLPELDVRARDTYWKVRQAAIHTRAALYRFDRLKTDKERERWTLRRLSFGLSARSELADGERALAHGRAIADGMTLAKDLANLPPNICTPAYLAEQAMNLSGKHGTIAVEIIEPERMQELGMGALLAVARGSREPARFIVLEYRGGAEKIRPHVLVGKGVTFDSGGISIKPALNMDEMKYDMSGAASVLGALQAVADLALPLNVVGLIPATENLPDGRATKPGDVITSLSGQTIEILNTDAEGRLILCDALTYAERYQPAAVIDVATLTGACVVALGRQASGLFSNHPALAHQLLEAGRYTRDRAWEMPLWEEYKEQLKSNFADVANIGGPEAGAVTAACFLSRFTKKYHWAHLDIAGTAWLTGKEKGATGRPVPLLVQYLLDRVPAA